MFGFKFFVSKFGWLAKKNYFNDYDQNVIVKNKEKKLSTPNIYSSLVVLRRHNTCGFVRYDLSYTLWNQESLTMLHHRSIR